MYSPQDERCSPKDFALQIVLIVLRNKSQHWGEHPWCGAVCSLHNHYCYFVPCLKALIQGQLRARWRETVLLPAASVRNNMCQKTDRLSEEKPATEVVKLQGFALLRCCINFWQRICNAFRRYPVPVTRPSYLTHWDFSWFSQSLQRHVNLLTSPYVPKSWSSSRIIWHYATPANGTSSYNLRMNQLTRLRSAKWEEVEWLWTSKRKLYGRKWSWPALK
jgi:hypothetical protein